MAAITTIEFGKKLRPSTIEAIKKINELVNAVNLLDPTEIDKLQTDVNNLKSTVNTHTSQINKADSSIADLKKTASTHTTDIDKIKVTLYTPLAADEATE